MTTQRAWLTVGGRIVFVHNAVSALVVVQAKIYEEIKSPGEK
jgi:uncharacterized membrane protein YcgQ (UPF0703/DUF1980 family)